MIINSVNYSSGGGELDYIPITTYAELISAFATTNTKPLRLMNDLTATAEIITSSTNTLDLHGHTITGTNSFRFMTINSGGNVTLCDLAVGGGGTITTFNTDYGGCVLINNGVLIINGGNITNCVASGSLGGGGVYIDNNSTFVMNGGTISGCKTIKNGGGVYLKTGLFNMTNGSITGCTINSTTSTSFGGGVYVNTGAFYMEDGTITNCNAGTGTTKGGGVHIKATGTFTMSGGIICMNTATTSHGGVSGDYTKTGGYVGGNTPQE